MRSLKDSEVPDTVVSMYLSSLSAHAGKVAYLSTSQEVRYEEFGALVKRIYGAICDLGVAGRRLPIAVYCEKSICSYALMFGIMASGNIYTPISPKTPIDKVKSILSAARVTVLITDIIDRENWADSSSELVSLSPIHPEELLQNGSVRSIGFEVEVVPSDTAYIMHTSGSTGPPKGVAISHRSIMLLVSEVWKILQPTSQDRFSQLSDLAFDLSMPNLLVSFMAGGSIVVPQPRDGLNPASYIRDNELSIWTSTPSTLSSMLKLGRLHEGNFPSVRASCFCGEALSVDLLRSWRAAASNSRNWNFYGPTECAVFATVQECVEASISEQIVVPIGAPFDTVQCAIEDKFGACTIVPKQSEKPRKRICGIEGELLLMGEQLAQGYYLKSDETRNAFVFREFNGVRRRCYRTGDLVSLGEKGELNFLGRIDRQVKRAGYRVELQEIENSVRRALSVDEVAVVPVFDQALVCKELVAIYVPNDKASFAKSEIRKICLEQMESFKIPDRFVETNMMFLNSSGKIDYARLRELFE